MDHGSDWIDVTVPLRPGMAVWPGDPELRLTRVCDMAAGAECTVSRLELGVHTGTHVDAPLHFLRDGAAIESLPLAAVVGPARVIEVAGRAAIGRDDLADKAIERGARVLLRTENSAHCWATDSFVPDYVAIDAGAARFLAERGVRAVGIDYLSIGTPGDEGAAVHRILLAAGIWLVEGLDLGRVAPGLYDMICLPLRLVGAEGAPARVILRPRGACAPEART